MVAFHPRRGVHEVGEAHRVAFGKSEIGERLQLLGDGVGGVAGDAVGGHSLHEPLTHGSHPRATAFGTHGLPELVGVGRAEPGDVDGHLHELFLEQRHPEGLAQRGFEQRMQVGDGLLSCPAPQIGMHGVALDGPGADERHLHHEVVELSGTQPRQRRHLSAALHLEHTHRVGGAQQVVDLIFLGDRGEVDRHTLVLRDEIDRQVQHRQHAEPEQVELHETGRRAVVLVPLENRSVLHARPFDGHTFHEWPVGHDHPTRVDPQMAGEVLDLPGEVEHEPGNRHLRLAGGARGNLVELLPAAPAVEPPGERVGPAG